MMGSCRCGNENDLTLSGEATMNKKQLFLFAGIVAISAIALVSPSRADDGKLTDSDAEFISKVSEKSHIEIELSKLAVQKATNDEVKGFAKNIGDDHEKALVDLQTIKARKSSDESSTREEQEELNENVKSHVDKFRELSGEEFDREYVQTMVDHHEESIENFDKCVKETKDSEIRKFAEKMLPTLKEHLQHAQRLQKQLKDMSEGADNK